MKNAPQIAERLMIQSFGSTHPLIELTFTFVYR